MRPKLAGGGEGRLRERGFGFIMPSRCQKQMVVVGTLGRYYIGVEWPVAGQLGRSGGIECR